MIGMDWMPDEPVPITATRLPHEGVDFTGPAVRVVSLASEAIGALDVDRLRQGQAATGHHEKPAVDLVTRAGTDVPAAGLYIPGRLLHAGCEADVLAQVVLVGHVIGVGENLRLGGVFLGPLPFPLQLRVE